MIPFVYSFSFKHLPTLHQNELRLYKYVCVYVLVGKCNIFMRDLLLLLLLFSYSPMHMNSCKYSSPYKYTYIYIYICIYYRKSIFLSYLMHMHAYVNTYVYVCVLLRMHKWRTHLTYSNYSCLFYVLLLHFYYKVFCRIVCSKGKKKSHK